MLILKHSVLSIKDPEALFQFAESKNQIYCNAKPFPHIVLDQFIDPTLIQKVSKEFPIEDSPIWHLYVHSRSKKQACNQYEAWGTATQQLVNFLQGSIFLSFLEKLTGIEGLISDPYFFGGGLHQTIRGGFLGIHADFNWHEKLRLDRRINLLIYLNENWLPTYGGDLELWTKDLKTAETKISPLLNRCVIFSTTDFAYHGQPDPLNTPEGTCRNSIALYYYSNGRPMKELSTPHSTLYKKRPNEANAGMITPNFFYKLLPPFVYDLTVKMKNLILKKIKH